MTSGVPVTLERQQRDRSLFSSEGARVSQMTSFLSSPTLPNMYSCELCQATSYDTSSAAIAQYLQSVR